MKIDLHCHTKSIKTGESPARNITPEEFKKKVNEANVKMIAITNHNHFDKGYFLSFKTAVNNDFIVLPGIELDVIGVHDEVGHVVLIADDNIIDIFDDQIQNIIKEKKPNELKVDIEDLITTINSLECIVLLHYWKEPRLDDESIDKLRESAKNQFRLFLEPSNYRALGILINHNYRGLKGSDHEDWDSYASLDFINVKLEMDSFRQFWYFIQKDKHVIETLLNKQTSYKINISHKSDNVEEVTLYDDVNVIFGTKGTGKTVMLNKIKQFFESKSKKISYYNPDMTHDRIQEKLTTNSTEKSLKLYGHDSKPDSFLTIYQFSDSDVTQIKDYVEYIKSKNKNKNKEKMKIVDISSLISHNTIVWNKIKTEYDSIKIIKANLNTIEVSKYLNFESERQVLANIINKLYKAINDEYVGSLLEKISIKLSNKTITILKDIVEKNTETKTKPSDSGLISFVKNRANMDIHVNSIISGFSIKIPPKSIFVGNLDSGKDLRLDTVYSMLDSNSKQSDGFKNITSLKGIKENIITISMSIYLPEIEGLSDYKENYNSFEGLSLDHFLGINRFFTVNGSPYKPSTGESTMIVLDEALSTNYDVYILDEPEKSLGNNYVNDVLVSKINDLAKQSKTIIVATHNANIAIRTFPYRSILKNYENIYKTYIGSLYTNELVNIQDAKDRLNFKSESLRILEGGEEAFEERRGVYGN